MQGVTKRRLRILFWVALEVAGIVGGVLGYLAWDEARRTRRSLKYHETIGILEVQAGPRGPGEVRRNALLGRNWRAWGCVVKNFKSNRPMYFTVCTGRTPQGRAYLWFAESGPRPEVRKGLDSVRFLRIDAAASRYVDGTDYHAIEAIPSYEAIWSVNALTVAGERVLEPGEWLQIERLPLEPRPARFYTPVYE